MSPMRDDVLSPVHAELLPRGLQEGAMWFGGIKAVAPLCAVALDVLLRNALHFSPYLDGAIVFALPCRRLSPAR